MDDTGYTEAAYPTPYDGCFDAVNLGPNESSFAYIARGHFVSQVTLSGYGTYGVRIQPVGGNLTYGYAVFGTTGQVPVAFSAQNNFGEALRFWDTSGNIMFRVSELGGPTSVNMQVGFQGATAANVVQRYWSSGNGANNGTNPDATWTYSGGTGNNDGTVTLAAGTFNLPNIANAAGNEILCYDTTNGPVTYESAVAGCVPSSITLKNVRGTIDPDIALTKITALEPGVYTYKDETKFGPQEYDGLYAEQVCAMDERLCARDKEGHVRNYDKVGMLAYLVAALKAQQQEIKALENRKH